MKKSSPSVTVVVKDSQALEAVKGVLTHGKTTKPDWWEGAKNFPLIKCPSVLQMVNNSIVFRSPTDIRIEWKEDGSLDINTASHLMSWGSEPLDAQLNINGRQDAEPYYTFAGGIINFRVHVQAFLESSTGRTIPTIWMPAPFFQKGSIFKKYSATPGPVYFPPSWPSNPIAMLSIHIGDTSKGTITIKKGEVLGAYYFVEGLSKVSYRKDPTIKRHTRSRILPGAEYLEEVARHTECPFTTRWQRLKRYLGMYNV